MAIAIFVGVAVSVASVVDLAARRTHQAARLRAESEVLSFLAGSVLRGEDSLDALLERLRETFAMDSVALLERASEVDPWSTTAAVGTNPVTRPDDADVDMPINETLALALSGRALPAEDRRVLGAFAAQAAVVLDRQRLVGEATKARELAEGNQIRTALLAAVSHDLRTPLAGIKAAVSSLRSDDVEWSETDRNELSQLRARLSGLAVRRGRRCLPHAHGSGRRYCSCRTAPPHSSHPPAPGAPPLPQRPRGCPRTERPA